MIKDWMGLGRRPSPSFMEERGQHYEQKVIIEEHGDLLSLRRSLHLCLYRRCDHTVHRRLIFDLYELGCPYRGQQPNRLRELSGSVPG